MEKKKNVNISFFVILMLPLLMVLVASLGLFFLFRRRIEGAYGMPIREIPPETRELLFALVLTIVIVLFITGLILALWIYKSVTEPLTNLGAATRKIRDGEYDFEITEEGPEELRELCRDFEDMRAKLKEAGEAKVIADAESKELISNISHDLRTPIASIKGYVEGIMDGVADTPEKMDHYVRTIYNKANEMDHLISELTFYSRIDTNRVPYAFAPVGVRSFFDDAAADIELELSGQQVRFSYENAVSSEEKIIADAEQVRRAISNIISNSLKYMDKEEKVMSMTVGEEGDFIKVCITDNGQGIPKQDIPNVFNRFYRADSSRHAKGGSGIGLSIVRKIMEDHGGRVYALSEEGKFTTMVLEFRKYAEVRQIQIRPEPVRTEPKRRRRHQTGV